MRSESADVKAGFWQGQNRTQIRLAADESEPEDEAAVPAAGRSEPDAEPAELPDERNAMGKKKVGILVAVYVLTGICIYAVISFLLKGVPVSECS